MDDVEEVLGETLADTTQAAFIDGASQQFDKVEPEIPDRVRPPVRVDVTPQDLEFLEIEFPAARAAAEKLATRGVYTPSKFRELTDEARSRAFTITARINQHDRTTIRDRIAEMARDGADRKAFMAEFEHLPLSESHLEQVFRNNVRQAFSDGMEDVLETDAVGEAFPFRAYNAIRDDRVRAEHLSLERSGLDGTNIYHKDDPVWTEFKPPWDWNCRCDWTALSTRQAAQQGVASAKAALESGGDVVPVFVTHPPFNPDPLWQRSHGEPVS